jgi:hypothetical protein
MRRYGLRDDQWDRINRDRGTSRDATPPTPPGIRVRTTAVRRIKPRRVSPWRAAIYRNASAIGKIRIGVPVLQLLAKQGLTATKAQIAKLAGEAPGRIAPGKRVNGSLLPFSLEGWKKSGAEE